MGIAAHHRIPGALALLGLALVASGRARACATCSSSRTLVSPRADLLARLAVSVPLVQALRGQQREGVQIVLALSYDVR